jgi:hypothetical protein
MNTEHDDIEDLLDHAIGMDPDVMISPADLHDPHLLMQAVVEAICGPLIDEVERTSKALQTATDSDRDNWDYTNELTLAVSNYTHARLALDAEMPKAVWAMAHTAFA